METTLDYLHQKAILLQTIVDLLPAGPERESALRDYVEFLREFGVRTNRLEWFLHVRWLRQLPVRGRTGSGEAKRTDEEMRGTILKAMAESQNGVMAFYAQLEATAPKPKS